MTKSSSSNKYRVAPDTPAAAEGRQFAMVASSSSSSLSTSLDAAAATTGFGNEQEQQQQQELVTIHANLMDKDELEDMIGADDAILSTWFQRDRQYQELVANQTRYCAPVSEAELSSKRQVNCTMFKNTVLLYLDTFWRVLIVSAFAVGMVVLKTSLTQRNWLDYDTTFSIKGWTLYAVDTIVTDVGINCIYLLVFTAIFGLKFMWKAWLITLPAILLNLPVTVAITLTYTAIKNFMLLFRFIGHLASLVIPSVYIARKLRWARGLLIFKVQFLGPILVYFYNYWLLPFFWRLSSDWQKMLCRILLHLALTELVMLLQRHFSRKFRYGRQNAVHLCLVLMQFVNSIYGRLIIVSMTSYVFTILTMVLLSVLEFVMRITVHLRDRWVLKFILRYKQVEMDKMLVQMEQRRLRSDLVVTDILVETVCIIAAPFFGYFYGVNTNVTSLVVNLVAGVGIEVVTDLVCIMIEEHQGARIFDCWNTIVDNHFLYFFLLSAVMMNFITFEFLTFVEVNLSVPPNLPSGPFPYSS